MIRKAVIPAAGRGTRFLPFSRAVPKEMLPLVDTPVIQHVVEEAVASGLDDIIIVISPGKKAIEEHFAPLSGAESARMELASLRRILERARIRFVSQDEPRGLGHAVAQARAAVGDEPFAVLLGDAITVSDRPVTQQLVELFEKKKAPAVALEEVPFEKVSRYGIVAGFAEGPDVFRVEDIVEKPSPADAPSRLAIAGRYVLTPDVFKHLAEVPPGRAGEIQLTDALKRMIEAGAFYGLRFSGQRFDTGSKADYLRAHMAFARQRPDFAGELGSLLR